MDHLLNQFMDKALSIQSSTGCVTVTPQVQRVFFNDGSTPSPRTHQWLFTITNWSFLWATALSIVIYTIHIYIHILLVYNVDIMVRSASIICPEYSPQHIQRPLVFRMHAEERLQCSVKILPHLFLRRDIAPVAVRVQVWLAKKQRLQGNYNIYQMRVSSICHCAPAFYVVFYFGIAVRFKDIAAALNSTSLRLGLLPSVTSFHPLWKELCVN